MFYKKSVLKNFALFLGKLLCWSLFLIKLQAFSPASLLKRDSNTGVFMCILRIFKKHLFWKTYANGCFWLFFYFSNLFIFGCLFHKKENLLWWRKCSFELDYEIQWLILKGHVKIVKIYMVKFNVSTLSRLKIMGFFVNSKCLHNPNVIFNKTVTKLVTILKKSFFPYLNPTSYLKNEKSF